MVRSSERESRTVGFVGWALADEARAEAWLAGTPGFPTPRRGRATAR